MIGNTASVNADILPNDDLHSSAECKTSQSSTAENREENEYEWSPPKVHVGKVCTAMPAPHHSDGGTPVRAVGVSVWEGELKPVAEGKAYEHEGGEQHERERLVEAGPQKVVQARKRLIRTPSIKDRKTAREKNQTFVYAVKNSGNSYIVTSRLKAHERLTDGSIRLFDSYDTLARNIKKARQWILEQTVKWNASAESFIPGKAENILKCSQVRGEERHQTKAENILKCKHAKCCGQHDVKKSECLSLIHI